MRLEMTMEFQAMVMRAMQIREHYAKLEQSRYGRAWTMEEIALGFVGDVGDLAKLVMALHGMRAVPDTKEKLGHELADCLWSVIVLAQMSNIDLENVFHRTMNELEQHVASLLEAKPSA